MITPVRLWENCKQQAFESLKRSVTATEKTGRLANGDLYDIWAGWYYTIQEMVFVLCHLTVAPMIKQCQIERQLGFASCTILQSDHSLTGTGGFANVLLPN